MTTRSWPRSRRSLASAASRPCATSSRTWSGRQAARSAEVAQAAVRAAVAEAAGSARAAAGRGRQIVRRPHDLAGAGGRPVARRARAGLPRLSAASGRQAVAGAREASVRRAVPMLFLQGTRDAARDARSAQAARQSAWHPRDPGAIRRRRPFLPRAGAHRPQRPRTSAARCSTRSPPGSIAYKIDYSMLLVA